MAKKTLGQVAYEARGCALNWDVLRQEIKAEHQSVADAVLAAAEAQRWRAIETAPKDRTEIDVWSKEAGRTPDATWLKERQAWCYWGFDDVESLGYHRIKPQPTHWTPIPAPPQEVDDAA